MQSGHQEGREAVGEAKKMRKWGSDLGGWERKVESVRTGMEVIGGCGGSSGGWVGEAGGRMEGESDRRPPPMFAIHRYSSTRLFNISS
jgi:hypothetical protein